jgi:DNA polymerase-1
MNFDITDKDLTEAKRLVKDGMEGVGKQLGLPVPLRVDLRAAHNWRVAHP